jgi:lantibiotic modifying enzyme
MTLREAHGADNRVPPRSVQTARGQGLLQGDTAEERFQSFINHITQPAHGTALLQEYPVLGRLVFESLDCWVTVSVEFVQRLCERYRRLAETTRDTLRRAIEQHPTVLKTIGGYSGWGGVIYALTHLAVLWGQPALLADAEQMVERLPDLIDRDTLLDVIAGSAGCVGSLLTLYQWRPADRPNNGHWHWLESRYVAPTTHRLFAWSGWHGLGLIATGNRDRHRAF